MIEDPRLTPYSGEYRDAAVELATFLQGYHTSCLVDFFDVM
jgi:hypothetical protein